MAKLSHRSPLREARRRRGLNQLQLARLSGVCNVTICHIEHNLADTHPLIASRLARALGMRIDDIWHGGGKGAFPQDARHAINAGTSPVAALAKVRGMNLSEIARIARVARNHVSQIAGGKKNCRLRALIGLARALDVHAQDLAEVMELWRSTHPLPRRLRLTAAPDLSPESDPFPEAE